MTDHDWLDEIEEKAAKTHRLYWQSLRNEDIAFRGTARANTLRLCREVRRLREELGKHKAFVTVMEVIMQKDGTLFRTSVNPDKLKQKAAELYYKLEKL